MSNADRKQATNDWIDGLDERMRNVIIELADALAMKLPKSPAVARRLARNAFHKYVGWDAQGIWFLRNRSADGIALPALSPLTQKYLALVIQCLVTDNKVPSISFFFRLEDAYKRFGSDDESPASADDPTGNECLKDRETHPDRDENSGGVIDGLTSDPNTSTLSCHAGATQTGLLSAEIRTPAIYGRYLNGRKFATGSVEKSKNRACWRRLRTIGNNAAPTLLRASSYESLNAITEPQNLF